MNYTNTTYTQNKTFQIYSGILSFLSTIPNLISIIIFIFKREKTKPKINIKKNIQIMLCITFIGIEIRFFPFVTKNESYYFFQAGISFSSIILSTYYQFVYSFTAYKLFSSPKDLTKKCNLFFIYIYPFILFIYLSTFVNICSSLTLYYNFLAYPENSEIGFTHELSKRLSHVFRVTFFLLNILFVGMLLRKIYKYLNNYSNNEENYTNKKFNEYLKKLIWYIISMLFVLNPYLFRKIVEIYFNNGKEALTNYSFSFYFHGMESLSGLIYWYIYIYDINLFHKFMILFCCKKESYYINMDILKENKIEGDINSSCVSICPPSLDGNKINELNIENEDDEVNQSLQDDEDL